MPGYRASDQLMHRCAQPIRRFATSNPNEHRETLLVPCELVEVQTFGCFRATHSPHSLVFGPHPALFAEDPAVRSAVLCFLHVRGSALHASPTGGGSTSQSEKGR